MSILTNEEKTNIINQHIKMLEYLKYNGELDLIEINAVSPEDSVTIQDITDRINAAQTKIDALIVEKNSLGE